VLKDPEKVSEAVEAAKGQINQIVREQVDRKLAKFRHGPPSGTYGCRSISANSSRRQLRDRASR